MTQTKVQALQFQIQEMEREIRYIQTQCNHPSRATEIADDRYFNWRRRLHCTLCDRQWVEHKEFDKWIIRRP